MNVQVLLSVRLIAQLDFSVFLLNARSLRCVFSSFVCMWQNDTYLRVSCAVYRRRDFCFEYRMGFLQLCLTCDKRRHFLLTMMTRRQTIDLYIWLRLDVLWPLISLSLKSAGQTIQRKDKISILWRICGQSKNTSIRWMLLKNASFYDSSARDPWLMISQFSRTVVEWMYHQSYSVHVRFRTHDSAFICHLFHVCGVIHMSSRT